MSEEHDECRECREYRECRTHTAAITNLQVVE